MVKKFLIAAIALALTFSAAACNTVDDNGDNGDDSQISDTLKNFGEVKTGVYTATSSYSEEEMSMTWNFVLTLKEDGSFKLTDADGNEKGAGTYALTDDCYTLDYGNDVKCTFVTNEDGTFKITSDFPYGIAVIQLSLVGDIVFAYDSEVPADSDNQDDVTDNGGATDETFTVSPGSYTASYTKESAMAGTVVYNYTAKIGEDGTFSYAVTFDMGGTVMDGSSASGTYSVDGGKFIFTDSEGNVTEGRITGTDTIVISLKASAMASDPYEVTFAPAESAE